MRQIGPDRIRCVVPGCGRTASKEWAGEDNEIICGPHWRMASRHLRRRYSRIRRLWRKAPEGSRMAYRCWRLEQKCWAQIKANATEVAMGIAA